MQSSDSESSPCPETLEELKGTEAWEVWAADRRRVLWELKGTEVWEVRATDQRCWPGHRGSVGLCDSVEWPGSVLRALQLQMPAPCTKAS